ncbi:hypothetical protein GCM10023196_080710 [Actinoallomurus vinaceus]|uniref:Uncharacterized protein n=1 Tax=Actinoallomurus vinaceus TaxID=1080074 RepID=A0ABP8UMM4_9ACTN
MTDLFTVSIDARDDRTLRGRVHIINPDACFFPRGPEFPMQVIMDAWWCMNEGFSFELAPFSRDEGKERATESSAKDEFEELYDFFSGKKVRVDAGGYLLEDGSKKVRTPQVRASEVYKDDLHPYGGQGFDGDTHYIMLKPKPTEFRKRAQEIIISNELGEQHNVPTGVDISDLFEDELDGLLRDRPLEARPYAEFTVEVSGAQYLEHLSGGMRWSTTYSGALPRF